MKLKHLIQAYNCNGIPAKIKEKIEDREERAGVITFNENINAGYLIDNKEDIVVNLNIFCNCLTIDKTLMDQLEHSINIINIFKQTIMLLDNVSDKEANMILENLGMFDNTFKESKKIKYLEHAYKIEIVCGLLMFSIVELSTIPPVKSDN